MREKNKLTLSSKRAGSAQNHEEEKGMGVRSVEGLNERQVCEGGAQRETCCPVG